MEAKELRIGNYITSKSSSLDYWEVTASDIEHISDNPSHYAPIPLTEDWLVKFGFKNKPNEMYINKSQYLLQVTGEYEEDGSINRDETWFDGIGDYSWIKEGGLKTMSVNVLCRGNYVCNCAKYVHQLQNLYFALTGEELTINE